jgi:hypothetical protein
MLTAASAHPVRTATVAAGLALLAVLAAGASPSAALTPEGGCGDSRVARSSTRGSPSTVKPGAAELLQSAGKSFRLRFDDSRATRSESIALVASLDPNSKVTAEVESDLVSGGDHVIHPTALTVLAHVEDSGNLGTCVALDPRGVDDLQAGTYEGALTISGESVTPMAVPITATFRDPQRNAFAWALGGFLLGAVCKALGELRGASTRRGLLEYARRRTSWIAILAGIAAAYYGFVQLYSSSRTWGAAEADGVKLLFTAALFQVSGVEGVELLRRIAGPASEPAALGSPSNPVPQN